MKGREEAGMKVTVIPMSSKEGPPVLKDVSGMGCTLAIYGGPSVSELTC